MSSLPDYKRIPPLLLSMGLIFFLSHQPGDSLELIDIPNIDKLLHCLVYGGLASAALLAVSPEIRRHKSWTVAGAVVLFCLLYGISDEFHQSFIPGRFASKWDLLADTVGGILAVITWFKYIEPRLTGINRQS